MTADTKTFKHHGIDTRSRIVSLG